MDRVVIGMDPHKRSMTIEARDVREVPRATGRFGTGTVNYRQIQRAETAATVHRILRKVLHRPTVRAKEFSTGPNGRVYLDALRQLFDLSAPADDAPQPRYVGI